MKSILDYCRGLPEQQFGPDEILLPEGQTTGRLYILIRGKLEISKKQYPIHVSSEPGAVFGEISALLGIPHTATVKAVSPSQVHAVTEAGTFLRTHQELAYFISKLLAKRLYGVTTYLVDLKAQFEDRADHLGMVDTVLESLLHQQDERFQPGSDRYPDPKI